MEKTKMKIPQKKILDWFLEHYGLGLDYYSGDTIENTLKGLKLIMEKNGLVELDYIGKFLLKLSENYEIVSKFLNELKERGF